jgi:CRISPR-associated protein Cst2
MRNALREILHAYGLPCNRARVHPVVGKAKSGEGDDEEKQQLAVRYSEYPDPAKFVDDFFFGYLLAIKKAEITKLRTTKGAGYPLKRDSVLRMNLAKALEPYRHNTVFTQSPKFADDNPWKPGGGDSAAKSALLHRETAVTAFQYPFALNLEDCRPKQDWTRKLLQAIGELNEVAGNHARSYFEMAPASIVVRLTPSLVAGYDTYGFRIDRDRHDQQEQTHRLPEIVEGILRDPPDYPGSEFFLGGKLVRDMTDDDATTLRDRKVTLDRDPRRLLQAVADRAFGG